MRRLQLYGVVLSESTGSSKFPERLRSSRELRGLSQADLAVKSGLQASAISHFETGRRSPSFDNLRRLADALSITTDYLLGRVDDPAASGPAVPSAFRDFKNMTSADQELISDLVKKLAHKNTRNRSGEDP